MAHDRVHDPKAGEAPRSFGSGRIGLVVALPGELGALHGLLSTRRSRSSIEYFEGEIGGRELLAIVAGVGKVRAAAAATILVEAGVPGGLLSAGVCGGLRRSQRIGDLVHCTRAVQADLAVRGDRECEPDPRLIQAWQQAAPGRAGWFLTADRPALSVWRRIRLARAYGGDPVAEMETGAIAAVAKATQTPWAGLRAISDELDVRSLGFGRRASFAANYPAQAGRAAATLPQLFEELGRLPLGWID